MNIMMAMMKQVKKAMYKTTSRNKKKLGTWNKETMLEEEVME